jgi:dTDP-glucose 4,6-dehydratase
MRRVLVTGADGFIGSHLVEGLVRAGVTGRAFVVYN